MQSRQIKLFFCVSQKSLETASAHTHTYTYTYKHKGSFVFIVPGQIDKKYVSSLTPSLSLYFDIMNTNSAEFRFSLSLLQNRDVANKRTTATINQLS